MPEKEQRVFRAGRVSQEEADRLNDIRQKVMSEFPPDPNRPRPAESGIGAQVRVAREAQGLSWYSLAERAGIENSGIVRDIEFGRDAKLSDVEAVAAVLGLKLELVEQGS